MISRHQLGATARGIVLWWIGELIECVPENLRRRLAALRGRLLLVIDDTGAYLVDESGRRREPLRRIDIGSGLGPDRAAGTGRHARDGATDVVIRLPADRALRSLVSLPSAAERNIEQVVGFEFERLTPFKQDEVYYTPRIVGRDDKARRLQIELTVVPRIAVEDAVQMAQHAGLRAVGVEVAGRDGATRVSCDLLLKEDEPAFRRLRRIALTAVAILAVALAAAAVAIPVIEAEAEDRALTAQVAQERREADESARLQKAIDTEVQDGQVLIERKRKSVPVTAILDEVTRLLPDDVWLTSLVIAGKQVHLTGFATSATSILGLLDQSSVFANAAFQSPVTQNQKINREQFDIAAQVLERHR